MLITETYLLSSPAAKVRSPRKHRACPAPARAYDQCGPARARSASPAQGAGAACAPVFRPAARVLTAWPMALALAVTRRPRRPQVPIGSLPRGFPTQAEARDAVRGSKPAAARQPNAHMLLPLRRRSAPRGDSVAPPGGCAVRAPRLGSCAQVQRYCFVLTFKQSPGPALCQTRSASLGQHECVNTDLCEFTR